MTADADERVVIPLRPLDHAADEVSAGPIAQPAHAREGKRAWLPSVTMPSLLAGTSALALQPPALLSIWAKHAASAKFYQSRWIRWPRWFYGAVHTWLIAAPLYLLIWVADSAPKLLAAVVTLVAILLLFGVI
jgi:hypothetical protein